MSNIVIPNDFAPLTVAESAKVDANFAEVATKFNSFAVQTDKANTLGGDLLFTDNLYDIGKSGATRPRDIFVSRVVNAPNMTVGTLSSDGSATPLIFAQGATERARFDASGVLVVLTGGVTTSGNLILNGANPVMQFNSTGGALLGLNDASGLSFGIAGVNTFWRIPNTGHLLAVADGVSDIGASGGTRPRDGFFSRNLAVGGTATITTLVTTNAQAIANNAQTTGIAYGVFQNTGTRLYWGVESSVGSGLFAGTMPYAAVFGTDSATRSVQFAASNVVRMTLDTGGAVLVGTTVTAGTTAGNLVIPFGAPLRSVNSAGTNTYALIHNSTGDAITVAGDGVSAIRMGNPASIGSAAAGEVVLAHQKSIRGVNAGGTDTFGLIRADAVGGTGYVNLGVGGVVVGIASPASIAGAAGGDVVLANAKALRSTNAAGTNTVDLIRCDASDRVSVGATGINDIILGGGSAPTYTTKGTTSVPTSTATTLFAAPAYANGAWLIVASMPTQGSTHSVSAMLMAGTGAGSYVLVNNGTGGGQLTLALSGTNVQATHTIAAGPHNVQWTYTRLM